MATFIYADIWCKVLTPKRDMMPVCTAMINACPKCSHANPGGQSHCSACRAPIGSKTPIEPAAELRTPTILFSDMSGFTKFLGGLEPEVVSEILEEVNDARN